MFFRFLFPALFSFGLFTSAAFAQDEATPDVPPMPGRDAGEIELAEAEAEPEEEEPVIERIVFRDDSLDQVLAFLERLTGRSIIRPQQLPSASITFNSQRALTRSEAILALESLLSINGITVVPLGEYFLKVVPGAQTQQHAPELMLESALNLSPSGRVASRLYQLEFLQLDEFIQRIQPLLTSQIGTVIPFEKANSMLVTETVSNLQRIETLMEAVDRPVSSRLETKFYDIQYAQAPELVSRLNNIRQTALQREISSKTVLEADERTNQIILVTDPRNVEFFDRFVEKMDIQTDPRTQNEVIQLKHADAEEVASLLSQLVSQQLGQTERGRERERRPPGENGRPEEPGVPEQVDTPPDDAATPEPEAPALPPEMEDVVEEMVEEMGSEFSSLLTILADERTNSLLVSGTTNDIKLIEALVDKIDVLLAQVRIEVVIAEVTVSDDVPRGIDRFGFSYTSAGSGSANVQGYGPAPGLELGFEGTLTDYTIEGVLRVAESRSEIDILSAPNIVTTHNREANIIVGEARPIVSSSVRDTGVTGFRSQVTFRDIGIDLMVKPLIGNDGVIQLEIDQSVDNVLETVTIGGDDQPVIGRKQATSFVSVADGEMVVLGGLQSEEVRQEHRRVAILGYIPLLGRLFSPERLQTDKRELLLFIRPTVMMTPDEAYRDAQRRIGEMSDTERIEEFIEARAAGTPVERPNERLAPAQRSPRTYD